MNPMMNDIAATLDDLAEAINTNTLTESLADDMLADLATLDCPAAERLADTIHALIDMLND